MPGTQPLDSLIELSHEYAGKSYTPTPIPLKGDGSDRKIYRFSTNTDSWIGVVHQDRQENRAFILLSQHFLKLGIPVPKIYHMHTDMTCYLLEDLGDTALADLIEDWNKSSAQQHMLIESYQQVLEWLIRIQLDGHTGLDYSFCTDIQLLDQQGFLKDIRYFQTYFWKLFSPNLEPPNIEKELRKLAHYLGSFPATSFVYRDFQSRNIMWKQNAPYFIDYQSGCQGAVYYDVASLLYASKAGLEDSQRYTLLEYYYHALNKRYAISWNKFTDHFYHTVLIRRLRSLGTYGYLPIFKGKCSFLKGIPETIACIHQLLHTQPCLQRWKGLQALFNIWIEESKLMEIESIEAQYKELKQH